jgi:hypothetical protein
MRWSSCAFPPTHDNLGACLAAKKNPLHKPWPRIHFAFAHYFYEQVKSRTSAKGGKVSFEKKQSETLEIELRGQCRGCQYPFRLKQRLGSRVGMVCFIE